MRFSEVYNTRNNDGNRSYSESSSRGFYVIRLIFDYQTTILLAKEIYIVVDNNVYMIGRLPGRPEPIYAGRP